MTESSGHHPALLEKINDSTRRQLALFLPDAIRRALTSYQRFLEQEEEASDPKSFSERHKACKVAVAHIELLLKLAERAELPDAKAEDHHNQILLSTMIQEAGAELHHFREREQDY